MTMIRVYKNDRVRLRDGRIVEVTDASTDPSETLEWVTESIKWTDDRSEVVITEKVSATMPNETIFVGRNVENGKTVVSDMCEVKMVIDKSLLSSL